MRKHFDDLDSGQLASVAGGVDELDAFAMGMDEWGGADGGVELASPVDELLRPGPPMFTESIELPDMDKLDYPPGTQFWENSKPERMDGAWWVRPGGGYDQATAKWRLFNDLFAGAAAGAPRPRYTPFR